MALTFEPLRIWFVKKKKDKGDLVKDIGVSPTTAAKIWNDRLPLRTDIIDRICEEYDLEVEEVIRRKKPGEE